MATYDGQSMTTSTSKSPTVDALITDLDGTFWSHQMQIHDASMAAVAALDSAEIPFVIATGRRAQSALQGLAPRGLDSRPGILMNGALARDVLAGDSFLVDAITQEDASAVLQTFRAGNLEPVAYIDHPTTDMLVGPGGAAGEEYLSKTVGYTHVDSLDGALPGHSVIGFGAFGFDYELLEPIAAQINDARLATAIIGLSLFEGKHGLMIQGHAVDKQSAIEAWCTRRGIDKTRLAVVGDGHNDIEMLSNAHIAIVPSNAAPEILELADAAIPPNEEGGWEQIPDIIGL